MEGAPLSTDEQRFYEMIRSKSRYPSTTSVLELGCSRGSFTDFLRQVGYDAEGVDGDRKLLLEGIFDKKPYIHYGDLTNLTDIFGNRLFDLIIAQDVFSGLAQMIYVQMRFRNKNRSIFEQVEKNIEYMLDSAYQQLVGGGFLIIQNDDTSDPIPFAKQSAGNIGLVVEQLNEQQAILQKPLTK